MELNKEVDLTAHCKPNLENVKLENGQKEPAKSSDGERRGRKRLSTDEEGEKKKAGSNKKYCNHRISLPKQTWDRWNKLKKSLNVASHSELACLLMDCWFNRHETSEQKCNTSESSLGQNASFSAENYIKVEGSEIKVEINCDNELTETLSNDSTDVEYDELVDFMNNMKKRKTMDDENICSEEMSQLDFNSLLTGNMLTCNTADATGFNTTRDKTNKTYDPDYDPNDDDNNREAEKPSRQKKKYASVFKADQKRKIVNRTPKNGKLKRARTAEPKKSWVKIQLSDHEDKFKIETVESFARMNRRIDASENLYSCLVCEHFKCASRDKFEEHIEKHVNKALECEDCQYVANSDAGIRDHRWTCSKRPKKSSLCSICGHWTASSESRRYHMGKVHGIPVWKCVFCPDIFRSRPERLVHMRIAHEEACQYCESCKRSKYLLRKEEYKNHLQNCSSNLQCQICGMVVNMHSMYKHMQDKHENIRRYQCHKCPYAAKTSRRLQTHLLSHDKIHPYSCNLCPFTCIQPNQLKSHMRTHTGEKPYKCTQCKYAAAWNVQLKEHVKAHSMGTAAMCQNCDIMFKNARTLNMHMKKEHLK